MTREELIYEVCPYKSMIDCHSEEPYTHFKCKDCSILMNNWFDEYDKQIRADAIDEFVKRLKAECRKHYVDCDPYFGGIVDSILYEDDIDEIAELLKERKE